MNLRQIKHLIRLVDEKQFAEFELEQGDFRLRIKRNETPVVHYTQTPPPNPSGEGASEPLAVATSSAAAAAQPAPTPAAPESAEAVEANLHLITAPIVGTFYRAPSPTAEPFVRQGDRVEPGTTLCILEAMKLMNEIPSEVAGVIVKIHVESGQPVEYGQPLFTIRVE